MREVKVNTLVTGHFSVFEDDGFTKHTGLTGSDFVTTIYLNSIPVILTVTITEIGSSGEYQYQFTPLVVGIYDLQILCLFNNDLAGDSLECVIDTSQELLVDVQNQTNKIDLAATIGPAAVTSGSLLDRVLNKDSSKSYNQGTDSLEAIRDRVG